MHPVSRMLVVTVLFVSACTETPDVSTVSSNRIVANRIVANRIVANKLAASKIAAAKLSATEISTGSFTVNMNAAAEILSTDAGREVFSALVACALPDTTMLETTIDDITFDFFGDLGLAPEWIAHPLFSDSKRWVSACLFSRVSSADIAVPISIRGPNPALATDSDERLSFSLQEGGFYGNYFTDPKDPIQWYACRGSDKAQGDAGDLVNRNCAAPDAANPGFTLCGFNYAGDCGMFGAAHACELFALGGTFYQRCHSEPTTAIKFASTSPTFLQVITTYVMP